MSTELKHIPLNAIRENPSALRSVDRESEEYLQLVDSIAQHGVTNAIVVRQVQDPENPNNVIYGLVDGLHRYTASLDAGRDNIPAQILALDDADVLYQQIIGNIHRVQTKPVEYSKQLQRILAMDPLLTKHTLAMRLNKTDTWISDRLGLLKLNDKVAELVDEGVINLSNAYALAKLPPEEQADWIERAQTEQPDEFTAKVMNRKSEIAKARREGRNPDEEKFTPVARLQKLKDVKDELESGAIASRLVKEVGVTDVTEAFLLGVKWCAKLDPVSIEVARRKHDEQKQAAKDRRENAKKERVEREHEKAQIRADRLAIEAEHFKAGTDATEDLKAFDEKNGLVDGKFPKKDAKEG